MCFLLNSSTVTVTDFAELWMFPQQIPDIWVSLGTVSYYYTLMTTV